MNLALNLNYDTVVIGGKTVRLNEALDKNTLVNRFVKTVAGCDDESAVCYILNMEYDKTAPYVRTNYNAVSAALRKTARIYNTFSVETTLLGRNVGAGFSALVKKEKYGECVELVEKLMSILGLNEEYQLISRYENEAVFVIIRK